MVRKKGSDRERRRHPRLESLYLVSYVSREGDVQKSGVSMARTVNISPAGVAVEVYQSLALHSRIEMEIAIRDRIFAVNGEVVHSQAQPDGKWVIGIQFDQPQDELVREVT